MDKVLITSLLLIAFFSGFFLLFNDKRDLEQYTFGEFSRSVSINGVPFKVEVASSPEKRRIGLSERSQLDQGDGMLFPFATDDLHGIWMRNMNFPIDIIWFDEDFLIVDIKRNAKPDSYPEVFRPKVPARYVLEINANLVEVYDIKIGDKATFPI